MDCSPPGSSVHGDSPGKNTGVGCHAFFQGIFSTQGLIPGLLHCRWILYRLSYQGDPLLTFNLQNSPSVHVLLPGTHIHRHKQAHAQTHMHGDTGLYAGVHTHIPTCVSVPPGPQQ